MGTPEHGIQAAEIRRINAEATIPAERYQEDGYDDRFDYLCNMAEDHGVTVKQVVFAADLMGPEEDFDGLVIMMEDNADLVLGC